MYYSYCLALMLIGSSFARCLANDDVSLIRNAHRATVNELFAVVCDTTFVKTNIRKDIPNTIEEISAHVVSHPNQMKVTLKDPLENAVFVWKNSIKHTLHEEKSSQGKSSFAASISYSPKRPYFRANPFVHGLMLFRLHHQKKLEYGTLDDLIDGAGTEVRSQKINEKGKLLYKLILEVSPADKTLQRCRFELTFDPSRNFLVTISEETPLGSSKSVFKKNVETFQELKPGLYFPTLIKGEVEREGKIDYTSVATNTNVVINAAAQSQELKLKYPYGIRMVNNIKDTNYTIDTEGNPISPEKQNGKYAPPDYYPAQMPNGGKESLKEELSFSRYLLTYSLLAINILLIFITIRRIKGK